MSKSVKVLSWECILPFMLKSISLLCMNLQIIKQRNLFVNMEWKLSIIGKEEYK